MAYSDQQIRDYAHQLEDKGASPQVIEDFVKRAVAERNQSGGATSPTAARPMPSATPPAAHAPTVSPASPAGTGGSMLGGLAKGAFNFLADPLGGLFKGPAFDMSQETNPVKGALKSVANTAKSVAGAGYGILNFFNPVKTAKTISEIPGAVSGLAKESGGAGAAAGNFAKALPGAAVKTIAPPAITKGFEEGKKGGVGEGAYASIKSLAEDPGQLIPYFLLGKNAIEKSPKAEAVMEAPTKLIKGSVEAVKSVPGKMGYEGLGLGKIMKKGESGELSPLQQRTANAIADNYRDVAGQTKQMRTLMQRSGRQGKDAPQWLAERNIVPEIKGGKIQTIDANGGPTYDFNALSGPLYHQERLFLDSIQPSIPKTDLATVENLVIQRLRSDRNINQNIANDLEKQARQEFADYRSNFGDQVNLSDLLGIKEGKWAQTKFDMNKPYQGTINYEIGKAAKDVIERSVPEEYGNVVRELNQALGDIYDAKKFYTSLDGKTVKGGRLGGYVAGFVGSAVGHGLPIPGGSILGYIVGESIADMLQSRAISNSTKEAILQNIQATQPKVYDQLIQYVGDIASKRKGQLALPPGQAIPLPEQSATSRAKSIESSGISQSDLNNPYTGRLEEQQAVQKSQQAAGIYKKPRATKQGKYIESQF